jgi:hypothetical protein
MKCAITAIITFMMVFLMQATQNRDSAATTSYGNRVAGGYTRDGADRR